MSKYHTHERGITVIEVLVGLAILLLIVAFLYSALALFFSASRDMGYKAQALHYLASGHEVVRYLRDDDWASLSVLTTGTTYYLDVATSTITISGTPEVIDTNFTRSFVLRDVYRNSDDDIVAAGAPGATLDTESYQVEVTVAWEDESVSSRSLLTNFLSL